MGDYVMRELVDRIAVVTMNRPPVNALNSQAYFELYRTMYDLEIDDGIAVIILTGGGEKAFVAGADVTEFLQLSGETGIVYTKKNQHVREYIRKYSKPVICAVNGLAYGGGCALALVCDIRIACDEAKFNLSEINMGILGAIPYAGNVIFSGTARRMVYSGESLTAQEALRVGLIDEVVPRARLLERCIELARKIAAKPPVALRKAKECLVAASEESFMDALSIEGEAIRELWGTEDKNEAVHAFLEKREPRFQGR